MDNYYKVLQVKNFASDNEIKQAYRFLAKKWHPDRSQGDLKAAEMFKMINEAYSLLSNPILKAAYDEKLRMSMQQVGVGYEKRKTAKLRHSSFLYKVRRAAEDLFFEEEDISGPSKAKKPQTLGGKIIDLMFEDED